MPRFVIYGTGAIGGLIGGRLVQHGYEALCIARGAQLEAIRQHGLQIDDPEGSVTVQLPVAEHPSHVEFDEGDLIILAMKTQDTQEALVTLADELPSETPIICAQNGVENERLALRLFQNVYGMCLVCQATYLSPGVVVAHSAPLAGTIDFGRYPDRADDTARYVNQAMNDSGWHSVLREDIDRWKYRKLIANLQNAVEAVCGTGIRGGPLVQLVRREGESCLEAAGIELPSPEEGRAGHPEITLFRPVGNVTVPVGSSWQSLARGSGSIETDYLNGEISLLGRLHGVPTPANDLLCRLARELTRDHLLPGTHREDEILKLLGAS